VWSSTAPLITFSSTAKSLYLCWKRSLKSKMQNANNLLWNSMHPIWTSLSKCSGLSTYLSFGLCKLQSWHSLSFLCVLQRLPYSTVGHGAFEVICEIFHKMNCGFWNQVSYERKFKQLRREAWKSQDFNVVWTRDPAILRRRYNQLNYEATDVGSWSFVGSN